MPVGAESDVAAAEFATLRVLLVHEWLYTWAGGERCLEELTKLIPHADVLAGIVTPSMRSERDVARRARETWVGRIPGARSKHRWFLPLHALAFRQFNTSDYDVIISISHAFEKAIRPQKRGAVHISYCLTPPRFLWNLSSAHEQFASPAQRVALRISRAPLRALDRSLARTVDHFVSLSHTVADRVKRTYGRDSAVVYPPVAAKGHDTRRGGRENYVLTLGRLVPYKRVDLAIAAAERLGVRLVVAGDGPELAALRACAGRTTTFVGAVSESEAARLLDSCSAFVFCAEEDFGIAPLEANAHGAPVVAYRRGGARETIRENETGVFFDTQTVDAVASAITTCLERPWNEATLRANAARFSPQNFRQGMRREINRALAAGGRR